MMKTPFEMYLTCYNHTEKMGDRNWSEKVEDLVESGDTDAAISLLESLISSLETQTLKSSQSQLVSALLELSKLYSSKGLSLKSDHTRARASSININIVSQCETTTSSANHGTCFIISLHCQEVLTFYANCFFVFSQGIRSV